MKLTPPDKTFIGSPYLADLDRLDGAFTVVGVPFGVPYDIRAVNSDATNAPAALRTRSLRFADHLDHYDFDLGGTLFGQTGYSLVDVGDVPGDPLDIQGNTERSTEAIRAVLAQGSIPIVLGGDDSIPPSVVAAYKHHSPINVIQIDAHLDFRDEVHGITTGYSSTMRRITEMPWVDRVFQIGMRGSGSAYPNDLKDSLAAGNTVITARDVHERGVDYVLDQLPRGERYFITLDVDGLDPSIAPGTSAPLPGGLTWSQAASLFRGVASRGSFVGMDVVEHFPSLDVGWRTSDTITRLILNVVGTAARNRTD